MTIGQIPLRDNNGAIRAYALVDAVDFDALNQYRWHMNNNGYAVRGFKMESGAERTVLMHRELLDLKHGNPLTGDHINRDRLDNRQSNLRVLTKAQNLQNRGLASPKATSSSGIRGVSWEARRQRWTAECRIANKKYWIGRFKSKDDAAQAVSAFRREHTPYSAADQ